MLIIIVWGTNMLKVKKIMSQSSWFEIITIIVTMILSVAVLVLSLLGLFNVLPGELTISIFLPLLGIILLLNGIITYKKNKLYGIFALASAAFVFSTYILIFVIKMLF
jgi:hypothetical protein